jgi:hypothetical protein
MNEVEYKGILYSHEKEKENLHVYNKLICNIFNDYYFYSKKIFVIAYATGSSVISPEHWCMLFIDFGLKKIFFYNSLVDEDQLCRKFITLFFNKSKNFGLDFKLYYNLAKQQFKNKLCGLFATDFAMMMLKCEASKRQELFESTFNKNGNFDKHIEKKQEYYIGVDKKASKSNALYRFTKLKKMLEAIFK